MRISYALFYYVVSKVLRCLISVIKHACTSITVLLVNNELRCSLILVCACVSSTKINQQFPCSWMIK